MVSRVLPLLSLLGLLLLAACAPTPPPSPAQKEKDTTQALESYKAWVLGEADRFLVDTEAFAAAIKAGDRALAQQLYPKARMPFERIEPIAEALGDFDPRIDAREGDVPDAEWRGYHKIEKILWSDEAVLTAAPVAEVLVADVRLLRAQLETTTVTVDQLVTGAVELLNEVSTSKVTGEEERYSHTDLYDFQANVEGAAQIWEVLSPWVRETDPELGKTIDARFSSLFGLLNVQKKDGNFRSYLDVYPAEVKALATAVDALAEPLSRLGPIFLAE